MADDTITELVSELATAPWTGPVGEAYAGIVCGVANDAMIEGASKAMQSALLYPVLPKAEDYSQPVEAIDLLGRDALLLRYPGEDPYIGLRTRVRNKWTFWQSGIKTALLAELAAAGFSGAQIKVPNDFTPRPAPSSEWSRFWVFFPAGTHPVTSSPGFVMANGALGQVGVNRLGPVGINTAAGEIYLRRLKDVLKRMKPAQWVAWDIIFELTAGVSYVHLQYGTRFMDPHYAYTSAGAALPLGV
jgi:hypothetical protein